MLDTNPEQAIQRKIQDKTAVAHDKSRMTDMLDSFLARGLHPDLAASEIVVVL
jgi:hypothetical protein